jgi:hypothetical protein
MAGHGIGEYRDQPSHIRSGVFLLIASEIAEVGKFLDEVPSDTIAISPEFSPDQVSAGTLSTQ